jgi:hypothetical protein
MSGARKVHCRIRLTWRSSSPVCFDSVLRPQALPSIIRVRQSYPRTTAFNRDGTWRVGMSPVERGGRTNRTSPPQCLNRASTLRCTKVAGFTFPGTWIRSRAPVEGRELEPLAVFSWRSTRLPSLDGPLFGQQIWSRLQQRRKRLPRTTCPMSSEPLLSVAGSTMHCRLEG